MFGNKIKDSPLVEKVSFAIRSHGMIRKGDNVVVAVSGGPDSVCLLDVLAEIAAASSLSLVIAHYNHRLRPGEDEAESAFIERLSLKYCVPLETGEWLNGPLAAMGSIEDQARRARYGFLNQVLRRRKAASIALGHNMNDQAETLLMRLLRGSGPQGLSAMKPVGPGPVIRPLLDISRKEILSYIRFKGLEYMVDSSNDSVDYLRNRIRLRLLPIMEEIQPSTVSVLSRVASIMKEDEECLSRQAEQLFEQSAVAEKGGGISFKVRDLSSLHPSLAKRVIRRAIEDVRGDLMALGKVHLEAIMTLLTGTDPSAQLHLPGGIRARVQYERIFIEMREDDEREITPLRIGGPGAYLCSAGAITVEELEGGMCSIAAPFCNEAYLDAEKVAYPIEVRGVLPGDRFVPLGMSRPKKLKKFLIDSKVPREKRRSLPVFVSSGQILWVGGMRIDERFRAVAGTKKILKISFCPDGF